MVHFPELLSEELLRLGAVDGATLQSVLVERELDGDADDGIVLLLDLRDVDGGLRQLLTPPASASPAEGSVWALTTLGDLLTVDAAGDLTQLGEGERLRGLLWCLN